MDRFYNMLTASINRINWRFPPVEIGHRRSVVITTCAMILISLWTVNAILAAWRLELGRNEGFSMLPTFGDGAVYLTQVRPPEIRVGDIVEARIAVGNTINRVVKRVAEVRDDGVLLEGDNHMDTWRGWVSVSAVEAKVLTVLWKGHSSLQAHSPNVATAVQSPAKRIGQIY